MTKEILQYQTIEPVSRLLNHGLWESGLIILMYQRVADHYPVLIELMTTVNDQGYIKPL
jgi:hypothetical protein